MANVEITVQASAEEDEEVDVSVKVTNNLGWHATFHTEVYADLDLIDDEEEIILDGQFKTYVSGFTMPNDDVTVLAWVEHWVTDHYDYYSSDSEVVTLYVPPTYYHGLKVQGESAELALCDVGTNPLRIKKGGTTYGIELVATDDANASRIRINTGDGVKALRLYT